MNTDPTALPATRMFEALAGLDRRFTLNQPHVEGSRADERQLQLALPAQMIDLEEDLLPGKIPTDTHQVIEFALRRASHDFKNSI